MSPNLKRSQDHYQENVLDPEAWFKIADRDYVELINSVDFQALFSSFNSPVDLLDVGCGTGKFPSMLREHLHKDSEINYDYLDPSSHCLSKTYSTLISPYHKRHAFHTTLEDLSTKFVPLSGYNVAWAIHSLYCVDQTSIVEVVDKLIKLTNPDNGVAMIIMANRDAFYHHIYDLYNHLFYHGSKNSFTAAEDITDALELLDKEAFVKQLQFEHVIPAAEHGLLEKYLHKCVFENLPLDMWMENTTMREFLSSYSDGKVYRFPQEVSVIMVSANADKSGELKRYWRKLEGV